MHSWRGRRWSYGRNCTEDPVEGALDVYLIPPRVRLLASAQVRYIELKSGMQSEREKLQVSGRRPASDQDRDRRAAGAAPPPRAVVGVAGHDCGDVLDWIDGREQSVTDPNGFQIPDGRVVLGIGAALLVTGVLMAKNRRVGTWFDADLSEWPCPRLPSSRS